MLDIKNREMNASVVRFRLANAGWSTFKIIINYLEQDSRCWKIIIGSGVENIDCVYKINHPNDKGELQEVFVLTDNQQYLPEVTIPANTDELIRVLQDKFPTHIFANPLKRREEEAEAGR